MKKIIIESFGDTTEEALAFAVRALALAIAKPPLKTGDKLTSCGVFGGAELTLEIYRPG